tara:strand:+ start:3879 stop:4829 length:951 start_codon:yes stop_codon:yes gene_type:complete
MKFKKPKFWDFDKPNLLSYLLLPFTFPIIINNLFLSSKLKKKTLGIKKICIGNIYLGGTGKTPSVIKLFNILKKFYPNICTGKKFYSSQIDEQILLRDRTHLICYKSREKIIKKAKQLKFEIIVFDDGLQDRNISYDLEIVCFDIENWIGNGYILPSGPLREKIESLKKYDAVFLKGENTDVTQKISLIKNINPKIKIFQTYYKPSNLNRFNIKDKYLVFSGIGNPKNLRKILLGNNINVVEEIIFPDHYTYKDIDIDKIRITAESLNAKIITTQKDYVKLSEQNRIDIDYLEVDLEIKDEEKLIDFIKSKIDEKY